MKPGDIILVNYIYKADFWMKCEDLLTHVVNFWGVKCYFDDKKSRLWGTNIVYDKLIPYAWLFQIVMSRLSEAIIPGWGCKGFRLKFIRYPVPFKPLTN